MQSFELRHLHKFAQVSESDSRTAGLEASELYKLTRGTDPPTSSTLIIAGLAEKP